jgi:hypothetical protein
VSTASVAPIPSSSEKKVSVPPKLLTQGEENQKKTEQYQGQPQTKEQILAAAKENAKPTSNECPSGGIGSKSEDIKSYVERQEGLQIRISAAIERLYRKEVEGNAAIAQFNSFIDESNQLIIWGRGKVTDEGVCNRPEITQRISKSYRTTEYLLKIYKQSL